MTCYPLRDHIKRKGGAAIPPRNAQVGSHPVKERPACRKIHQIIPKRFSSHERVGEDGDAGPGQAPHRFTVVRCVLNYLQYKHLKGQLGHDVSDEKVYVTQNDNFLKLCSEGQLGPPNSDKKVCVTKNDHFLKMCCVMEVSWDPPSSNPS